MSDEQHAGQLPIPSPADILKDKLKQLAIEYGSDALSWAWDSLTKKVTPPKPLPAASTGSGALVALALLALATKKKKRRR